MDDDSIQQTILYTLVEICKTHRTRIDQILSGLGVASGHEMFLLSLLSQEGMSHAELAEQLRIVPATITNILNRMEKAELVTRQQDAEDRRIRRVYLTEKGRELRHNLRDIWLQAEQETTQGLSLEERLLLRRLLLHVYANILDHD